MTTFKQDDDETPVIFRAKKERGFPLEVTAVFPCEPSDLTGHNMTCYAHVGQHGGCALPWYWSTRAAKPEEYADLKAELEGAPYGYRLKVYKRMDHRLRAKFHKEVMRLKDNDRRLAAQGI